MPALHRRAEFADLQALQLMLFEQRYDDGGVPRHDRVQIKVEISVPRSAGSARLFLARRQREANQPIARLGPYLGDLKRMGLAGAHLAGTTVWARCASFRTNRSPALAPCDP